MNALAHRRLPPRTMPARDLPPPGVRPEHVGNGRIEVRIYPAATEADRLRAALMLLHGTRWSAALERMEGITS